MSSEGNSTIPFEFDQDHVKVAKIFELILKLQQADRQIMSKIARIEEKVVKEKNLITNLRAGCIDTKYDKKRVGIMQNKVKEILQWFSEE